MTLEEHILKAEEDARTAESDAEWGIGNYFINRTEAIEYAKECRNLVNWLKDYKRLLEQEPKVDIALERYKDLQDYFGDKDIAKAVLENQAEFKAWLERLHWNTKKVDELARKLEALEQEPKTDTDCISRGYLLGIANKGGAYGYVSVHDIISAPCYKAQEPKAGHWIEHHEPYTWMGYIHWSCSECGYGEEPENHSRTNYCPNCGAKMESESEYEQKTSQESI